MKYETKPIDFTGCHPVIAEHLKRGEQVRCWVWDDDKERGSGPLYICAYIKEEGQYPYKTDVASWWTHAEPVPQKIRRVKKASEIIRMLEDEGYVYAKGSYSNANSGRTISITHIHAIAGKEVNKNSGNFLDVVIDHEGTIVSCSYVDWIEEFPK